MTDVSLAHISKCFWETMLPVEQIWKDSWKIVFIHDAGQLLKVDLQIENSYSVILWPELGEYINEGRLVDEFLWFWWNCELELEVLKDEMRANFIPC